MNKTDINSFLELSRQIPVVDVRSPSEYMSGHIPGAFNIPLFDDEQRAAVGTKYKKEGRVPAISEGLKLAGPLMYQKLDKALEIAIDGDLLVHCWRGGMRSEAMAWLFSMGGLNCRVLEGGYKSYRNHILDSLSLERKMIVLGGMTGSSKTHILRFLMKKGHQVIDLEALANHKGSAFGNLGQPSQPSTEQFANDLYKEWMNLDPELPVWLEDESRNIGTVFMPEGFYNNMQKAKTIVLKMDINTRMPRLLAEYSEFPPDLLRAAIIKISRRLGGDNTREAINAIDGGDFATAIEITLRYYDKAYQYSLRRKTRAELVVIETDTDDIEVNAMKALEATSGK